MCTQCSILLHLMDICFLTCICLWHISQIQTCLCVFVGPGFVSSPPVFMRSSAIHPAGPHGRRAQTNCKSGSHFWGREFSIQFAPQFVSSVTAPPLVCCVVWSIVSLVLPLTFCANVQSCHWLEDGKLWCNGVRSREGGLERTIIRI